MLFLSNSRGRFPVGATTFLTHVKSPHAIGNIKLRESRQPALYLEEVAFTAYYPADTSAKTAKKGLHWVIRPVKESLRGFAKFSSLPRWVLWPVVYLFGAFIRIPVYPNAPLAYPPESLSTDKDAKDVSQWPLVIFSHGLGGSRTAYSQLCSQLAASGKIVLAMEHRDGTGCACITRVRGSDGTPQYKPVLYYKDNDIILDDIGGPKEGAPFLLRTDQLELRREEIHTAYQTFSDFVRGHGSSGLETIDNTQIDYESWSHVNPKSGKIPVNLDTNITLAGHSFGGCTVLSILTNNPPSGHTEIPVSHALILDPWLEPLPLPGPIPLVKAMSSLSAHSKTDIASSTVLEGDDEVRRGAFPRMLVINSEYFTLWKPHHTRLQDVLKAWEPEGRRLLTLVGSTHEAFSDFPNLPFIRKAQAKLLMNTISKLSISFLDGCLEQALHSVPTIKMEIQILGKKKDGHPKRKLVGNVGDVVVQ